MTLPAFSNHQMASSKQQPHQKKPSVTLCYATVCNLS
jgi:hypothetical protein